MITQLFLVALTVSILIVFIMATAKHMSRRRNRNDERDTYKAEDIARNPALLEQSQQAAELQIGEDEEAVSLSRFQPDTRKKHRTAIVGKP